MIRIITAATVWLFLAMFFFSSAVADEYEGTVRAGYIYTDIEGNQGVHQPTFNLYDGMAFSLEQFRYQWTSGLKLTANVHNPFLDNRRLNLGVSRPGLMGVTLNHSANRRTYSFDGSDHTRRQFTSGSAWLRPIKQVKLFGGFDNIDKVGTAVDLIEPELGAAQNQVDYTRLGFHGGVEVKHRRSGGRLEYRLADFNDDRNVTNDRQSKRLRLTFYSPLPKYEQFVLSGGLQHFENRYENRPDTLSANTVWGAMRYSHELGYHVRYSFMFDRARRTGDYTASDKIIHTIHAGKTWRGRGGMTVGYGTRVNDDESTQRSAAEYSFTGWVRPIEALLLRGGYDFESDVIDAGRTLTGDRDRTRHHVSAKYTLGEASLRVKLEERQRENDDIGSKLEFTRISTDLSYSDDRYGMATASYTHGSGDYDNTAGQFEYTEHTFFGEAMSREYRRVQAGVRGMYYRAQRDVDIESFTVEFTGRFRLMDKSRLEVVYAAHNFDDLDDPAEFYERYFTANVVTAVLVYEL